MKNASYIVLSIAAIFLFVAGIVVGYFFFSRKIVMPVVTVSYVTNYATKYVAIDATKYTNDCRELAEMYTGLRSNYYRYVDGVPEVLSNAGECTDIRIADSVYRVCSKMERTDWYADISAGYMAGSGVLIMAGGGWECFRAGAVATIGRPDVGAYIGYRHRF